jgi:hypothetical protein
MRTRLAQRSFASGIERADRAKTNVGGGDEKFEGVMGFRRRRARLRQKKFLRPAAATFAANALSAGIDMPYW